MVPEIEPQLATAAEQAPEGAGWIHEIKYDGYRLIAEVVDGRVRLLTRHRNDWTDRFPSVAAAVTELGLSDAVLDGEVVVIGPDGRSLFQELQNVLGGQIRGTLRYCLFDLPYLEGEDHRDRPLLERKRRLSSLLASNPVSGLYYSDHVEGNGGEFLKQACGLGLEGILSKRADAPYRSHRSRDWLKVKCANRQEFVVVGYTDPGGGRPGVGALLLGYRTSGGEWVFAGRVGSGFSERLLHELRAALESIARPAPPFKGPPPLGPRGVHWVEPRLVVEVAFTGWTAEGVLRHPTFKGFREDKDADEVIREGVVAPQEPPVAIQPSGKPTRRAPGRAARAPDAVEVEGVVITHPDKVLYPESGVTKLEVARYYASVAPRMLPYLRGRPLTLLRCPVGIGDCFYQKQVEAGISAEVQRVVVADGDGTMEYATADTTTALITLVQLGVLEFHTWGSRRGDVERPDRFTIDLDPDPTVPWLSLARAALEVRNLLLDLGLDSFLKVTGGKGLHVVVPIEPDGEWAQVKAFAQAVAQRVAEGGPGRYTLSVSRTRRVGRILIDYLRNARSATAIEAFSTRARTGATVALPVAWEALATELTPGSFTVRNVGEHLEGLESDPWEAYSATCQVIDADMRRELGLE